MQLPHQVTHHLEGSNNWAIERASVLFGFGKPLPSSHGAPISAEEMMCAFVEKMANKGAFSGRGSGGASRTPAKPVFLDDQLAAVQKFMRIGDEQDFLYWKPSFYKKIESDRKTTEVVGVALCQ